MLKPTLTVFAVVLTASIALMPMSALGAPTQGKPLFTDMTDPATADQSITNGNNDNAASDMDNDDTMSNDMRRNNHSSDNSIANENSGPSDRSY